MTDTNAKYDLDFEQLLKPISDDKPVGEYLRYEGLYDQIEELRKEDDPNLPQGVWQTELKTADWNGVYKLASESLATRSKDLQLASWVLESLILLQGAGGVVQGVQLIYQLCVSFWDSLYPALDKDDMEFRISPFLWINSVLSEKLKGIAIIRPDSEECQSFSFQEWEKMVHLEALAKQSASARRNLDGEMKFTRGEFNRSVEHTPLEFLVESRDTLQSSLSTVNELRTLLDDKCGKMSPSLEQFRKTLETILSQIKLLVGKREKPATDEAESGVDGAVGNTGGLTRMTRYDSGFRIKNRDEAYHFLSEIAEYLLETDPHSPVPFLVKRAVSWGAMSLSELLTELLKDGQNLQQIHALLGIQE
jgi:type VI secretion system ImpA family protein